MSHGYGGRQNNYQQLGNSPDYYQGPQPREFVQNQPYQSGYGQNNHYQDSNFEMSSLPHTAGRGGGSDSTADIYSEIKNIENEIKGLNAKITELGRVGARSLSEGNSAELERRSSEVMDMYRSLVQRFGKLKAKTPAQSGPARQVDRVENDLKLALGRYNTFKSQYGKGVGEQAKRQLLVVRPDASQQEIAQAVEVAQSGEQLQVFQQALQNTGRTDAAREALHYVTDRHTDLQRIERDVQELAELMQTIAEMSFRQEELVMKIEEHTEVTNDNLERGVGEMEVAVETARKTRKKKWICLGICVTILIIVVIVVLVYVFVIRGTSGGNKNSKRELEGLADSAASSFMAVAAPHAKRLDSRSAINEALAEQMARLTRERIHFPQFINN